MSRRPTFAELSKLKLHFPSVPLLAVTATATAEVERDLLEILQVQEAHVFRSRAGLRTCLGGATVGIPPSEAERATDTMSSHIGRVETLNMDGVMDSQGS